MSSNSHPKREEFWGKLPWSCPVLPADSSGAVGSSDVVVLLHGFPTSSYDWSKVRGWGWGSKSWDFQLLGMSRAGPCSKGEFIPDSCWRHRRAPGYHLGFLPA